MFKIKKIYNNIITFNFPFFKRYLPEIYYFLKLKILIKEIKLNKINLIFDYDDKNINQIAIESKGYLLDNTICVPVYKYVWTRDGVYYGYDRSYKLSSEKILYIMAHEYGHFIFRQNNPEYKYKYPKIVDSNTRKTKEYMEIQLYEEREAWRYAEKYLWQIKVLDNNTNQEYFLCVMNKSINGYKFDKSEKDF